MITQYLDKKFIVNRKSKIMGQIILSAFSSLLLLFWGVRTYSKSWKCKLLQYNKQEKLNKIKSSTLTVNKFWRKHKLQRFSCTLISHAIVIAYKPISDLKNIHSKYYSQWSFWILKILWIYYFYCFVPYVPIL